MVIQPFHLIFRGTFSFSVPFLNGLKIPVVMLFRAILDEYRSSNGSILKKKNISGKKESIKLTIFGFHVLENSYD